jgi:hypothetical protein
VGGAGYPLEEMLLMDFSTDHLVADPLLDGGYASPLVRGAWAAPGAAQPGCRSPRAGEPARRVRPYAMRGLVQGPVRGRAGKGWAGHAEREVVMSTLVRTGV